MAEEEQLSLGKRLKRKVHFVTIAAPPHSVEWLKETEREGRKEGRTGGASLMS